MGLKLNPFTGQFDIDTGGTNIVDPIIFKGSISINTDFPLAANVQTGWFYRVLAGVTDNAGASYTNTGQSFVDGDEIVWNGTNWTLLGNVTPETQDLQDVTDNGSVTTNNITIDNGGLTNNNLNINGSTHSTLRSTATDLFQILHGGSSRFEIDAAGDITISGDVSANNLSGINTGDQDLSDLVVGPVSVTDNDLAQFDGTTGKLIKDGLSVVTTLGSPGTDSNIPTEQAVREAINAAGGGDVNGPASSVDENLAVFDGTNGKTIKDGGINISDIVVDSDLSDYALLSGATFTGAISATNLSGTNTGDQTITLTGDVTGTGTGSFATTIANDAVTTSKIANSNVTLSKLVDATTNEVLLGRYSAGSGVFQEIVIGSNLSLSGNTLNAAGSTGSATWGSISGTLADQTDLQNALDLKLESGDNVSNLVNDAGYLTSYTETQDLQDVTDNGSTTTNNITANSFITDSGTSSDFVKGDGSLDSNNYLTGNENITLSGAITGSGTTSISTTLANNAVTTAKVLNDAITYAKLQNVTGERLLGRYDASNGDAQEIEIGTGLSFSAGVLNASGAAGTATWGGIAGDIADQTDLQNELADKLDKNTPITGSTKTKITYDADGLVTAGANATTADINDSTNRRYVTDAEKTVIGNTSGTNTGDQDLSGYVAATLVTTVGTPGSDTNVPSEQAVREAISASGGGDVSGPASSVDGNITTFSGTSGKLIQDSGVAISDITGIASTYLKLDTSNDPLTGNLEILKTDPQISLTDNNNYYTRLYRNSSNTSYLKSQITVPAIASNALRFDGTSGRSARVTDNDMLAFGSSNYTVTAWVKTTATDTALMTIYGAYNGGGIYAFYRGSDDTWYTGWVGSGGQNISGAVHSINDGNWHFVVSRRTATDTIELWIDNNLIATKTGITSTTSAQPADFEIGSLTSVAGREWDGDIDEVAIWGRALTDDDISDLYNSGSGLYLDIANTFPTSGTPVSTNLVCLYHLDEGTGTNVADSSGNGYDGYLNNSPSWINPGFFPETSTVQEVSVLTVENGGGAGEKGVITLGNNTANTKLQGGNIGFDIGIMTRWSIDEVGDLVSENNSNLMIKSDSAKLTFGLDNDWEIYSNGTSLTIDRPLADSYVHILGGDLLFGSNSSPTLTSSPDYIDLGGTYGNNVAGRWGNLKFLLYNSTTNKYGLGISGGTFEYQAGGAGEHVFYVKTSATGGNEALRIDTNSNTKLNGKLVINNSHTPSSASDTGTAGTITWDTNYIYVCTATDTWKRVAIATW